MSQDTPQVKNIGTLKRIAYAWVMVLMAISTVSFFADGLERLVHPTALADWHQGQSVSIDGNILMAGISFLGGLIMALSVRMVWRRLQND